jgi:sugar lactone lactonase YvrE
VELSWESTDWAHPAIELRDGTLWVTHPDGHTLEAYDLEGRLLERIETDLLELHYLRWPWAVDTGSKRVVCGGEFETVRRRGRVVRLDDGFELPDPYPERKYSPTAVAVGPDGNIWVADGYGQSLVHRFTPDGRLDLTLDGFDTPHAVTVVGDALLVCDRANGRIQELDLDGTLRRSLGVGAVVTPTDLAVAGGELVVTDFTAGRVTVLTRDGELVEHLFAGRRSPDEDGWPNAHDTAGDLVRPPLRAGAANSPHTLAADSDGSIYVTEWLIGGRVTKRARYRGEPWISG